MNVTFELCRDLRHHWKHVDDVVTRSVRGKPVEFTRHIMCAQCGTVRLDTFQVADYRLVRAKASYRYPKGYRVPGGVDLPALRYQRWEARLID